MALEEKYKAEFEEWMTENGYRVNAEVTIEHLHAFFMIRRRSFTGPGAITNNDACAACGELFQHPYDGNRYTTCRVCVEATQAGEKPKFNDAKQVILVRKDLAMPAGKMAAQVAHASMACLLNMGKWQGGSRFKPQDNGHTIIVGTETFSIEVDEGDAVHDWMTKSFPKITLEVKNEAALKRYYDEAVAAGLPTSWIVDAGRTIFNGVPTPTCVGIGPASREQIDAITKRLRVYQ